MTQQPRRIAKGCGDPHGDPRTVINNFTFDGATRDPMQRAVRDALVAFIAATSPAQVVAALKADASVELPRTAPIDLDTRALVSRLKANGAGQMSERAG